ncbi:MAG: anaerobic glycerol-3-phosphate dehydrogenase subunit A [Selenomonadaceae bacterium]|nr:anaerobic glycerol-3-phosphate dehydrogenase subunit A [Selenomonadaceae bacterium]
MNEFQVVIIGGGATGVGILRDLSMRGISALLIEKGDLTNGASSRFHGLLHSGGRYAAKDIEAAKECIAENIILRKIGGNFVEETEGMFIRLASDDPLYKDAWLEGCKAANIPVTPVTLTEARIMEPSISPNAAEIFLVPDAAIDGFRMAWQNIHSAKKYGAKFITYSEVVSILSENGKIKGVEVKNTLTGEVTTISAEIVVNAAGGWAGKVAALAGLSVRVQPDKGTLIAFNRRITKRVVNRLHQSSDGDIMVPHGPISILGTSSISVDDPEDTSTSREEVEKLLRMGEAMFPDLRSNRILRVYAGSRPLYIPEGGKAGRGASRGFAILDHEIDGLDGMFTIVGGKFTTYRLMAEKISDQIAKKLGNTVPCKTATETLVDAPEEEDKEAARKYFPSFGLEPAVVRLGRVRFGRVAKNIKEHPKKRQLVCECENITLAEVEEIANEDTTHNLNDLRRRTRIGMGTCQGSFCALRAAASFYRVKKEKPNSLKELRNFLEGRFKGIRPVLFGKTLKETEFTRALYELSFNIGGSK